MKKKILTLVAAAVMTMAMSVTAFAHTGVWLQDDTGWWWQRQNGNYPTNQWVWIDGNGDGIVECYYFGPDGYMLANTTTPDGYTVDANGAWTVNGVVQSRAMQPLTDDNYIPGQDVTGAVTDPNATAQITVNEEIWNAINNWDSTAPIDMANAIALGGYDYQYDYNGNQLKITVPQTPNGQYVLTSVFGPAKALLDNIPATGIEVKAFFENGNFEDPYGDAGGHVHGSTGNLDKVFNTSASELRVLEVKYDNGQTRHLWVKLTQGTDGNWYIYPDSPAYLG